MVSAIHPTFSSRQVSSSIASGSLQPVRFGHNDTADKPDSPSAEASKPQGFFEKLASGVKKVIGWGLVGLVALAAIPIIGVFATWLFSAIAKGLSHIKPTAGFFSNPEIKRELFLPQLTLRKRGQLDAKVVAGQYTRIHENDITLYTPVNKTKEDHAGFRYIFSDLEPGFSQERLNSQGLVEKRDTYLFDPSASIPVKIAATIFHVEGNPVREKQVVSNLLTKEKLGEFNLDLTTSQYTPSSPTSPEPTTIPPEEGLSAKIIPFKRK